MISYDNSEFGVIPKIGNQGEYKTVESSRDITFRNGAEEEIGKSDCQNTDC